MALLGAFGGIRLSAQTLFTNTELDWLSHKLIQLNSLQRDSIAQAQNLLECDSMSKLKDDKIKTWQYKHHETDSIGKQCATDNTALTKKYNKIVGKIKAFKNGLLITIPISILEGIALWYVLRNKK